MSVVAFERKQEAAVWTEAELNAIVAGLHSALAPSGGRTWETGETENGDVQFYLLGPQPEEACELCVSRIGRRYILEDGSGRLLLEHRKSRSRCSARKGRSLIHAAARGARNSAVVCGSEHNPGKIRADPRRRRRASRPGSAAARGFCLSAASASSFQFIASARFESVHDREIIRDIRAAVKTSRKAIASKTAAKLKTVRLPGMESGRSLFRDRRAGSGARSRENGRRLRRV